ncbi:MAG: hypothetical protein AB2815_06385 [Candidatus Sedimenticola endophacoides]
MMSEAGNTFSEYDRLKELNDELSDIGHQRGACRRRMAVFGAVGSILMAISGIGFLHNVVHAQDDWARNPNSPVHHVVSQDRAAFKLPIPAAFTGFLIGFGLFFKARGNLSLRERLCNREWELNSEMRALRDQMYPHDIPHHERRHPHRPEHTRPLTPEEARGEYVGVYSPRAKQPSPEPGTPALQPQG